MAADAADDAALVASMKGFPRRGSDIFTGLAQIGGKNASMKGFPRRGSDMLDVLDRWARYKQPQ
mgnify:CR=1 FL=1